MTTPTPDTVSRLIGDYLGLARAIKAVKARQDEIKEMLELELEMQDAEELATRDGTVKRITVAKSVSFTGSQVYELASVWHVSHDPIFKQCGSLLMNLAKFRSERHYLRISAPK